MANRLTRRNILALCSNQRPGQDVSPSKRCADRKSTRLNSSHTVTSYAVFCLKKKKVTHYKSARSSNASGPAANRKVFIHTFQHMAITMTQDIAVVADAMADVTYSTRDLTRAA